MAHRRLAFPLLAFAMIAALLFSPGVSAVQAAPRIAPDAPDASQNYDVTLSGPIPDGGCASWPFTRYFLITDHRKVTDINLGLNVTHGNRGQLRAKLTSPTGTVVTLFDVNSNNDDTNYDILLDADVTGALDDNTTDDTASPYYDRNVQTTVLNTFDGEDAFGGWQLQLCDNNGSVGQPGGTFNRAQLQLTYDPIATFIPIHKQGPAVFETYYMPWPENQLWAAMGEIYTGPGDSIGGDTCTNFQNYDSNPRQPMLGYSSITISEADTVIAYDHWEDGYEATSTFPAQATTEVWGDGDLQNGKAPKDADDVLVVGQVLILDDVMDSSTLQTVVDYDARDKISSSQPIAVTRAVWSDGSKTLFAHADEVYPTSFWGTDYRLPVGENADLYEMFEYAGVSVMAATDGTVVSIDKDANGTAEQTCNLNQGQSCQWNDSATGGVIANGLNRNSRITSNVGHPIQVNLLTGDYCAGFETRSYPLWPVDRWSTSYYNPVGTHTVSVTPSNDDAPTEVHLYNPNPNAITVNYQFATGSASTVSVPGNSGAHVKMNDLTGARFWSAASTSRNVRDTFATQSYSRQDGSANWTTNWDETGDDDSPTSGSIQVSSSAGALALNFQNSSALDDTIERQANLSGATAATLSFSYSNDGDTDSGDVARVLISKNGGSTWTSLTTFAANTSGSYSTIITSDIASNTRVRFEIDQRSGSSSATEWFYIDNVDITYTVTSGDPLPFYAIATVDSDEAPTQSGDNRNDTYDWGITLVPESLMTQWIIAGWAPGDDPTFLGTAAENTSPIWLTGGHPSGSSQTGNFDVCIDDNGNGGSLTDPITTRTYDRKITGVTPRSQQKIYTGGTAVAGQDQTATQIWVCTSGSDVLLTAAWGEDGRTAAPGTPAMDMGDTVRNNPKWRATKGVNLQGDANGNGLYDEGETVRYSIVVRNTGVSAIQPGSITIVDSIDDQTTYVPGSTYVDYGAGAVQISDNGSPSTAFPLDETGWVNASAIPVRGAMVVTFDASVDAGTGSLTLCNIATASDGEIDQTASACFPVEAPLKGAIGNYVWLDENSDGYQDAGEPGIPNVQVNLYNLAGTLVASTYTNANGGYLFDGLAAGTYYVDVLDGTGNQSSTLPVAGMTQTAYNLAGSDLGNQNHSATTIPNTTLTGYQVVLASGGENLTADFGYNYNLTVCVDGSFPSCTDAMAAIGDRVWIDADGDGFQDPNEVGLAGVTVTLYHDPDGNGVYDTAYGSTTTNSTGYYLFDGLPPTGYVVVVTPLPAYPAQTGDPDHFGTTGTNDNKTTTPIILAPGDVFLNADFGYQPPAAQNNSIGDIVWFDRDADGVGPSGAPGGGDTSEYGIPGVTVDLIRDSNGDGIWQATEPIIATTVTDASGKYLFPGLPDGNYLVWVSDTDNVLGLNAPTYDSNGGTAYAGNGAPIGVNSTTVLGLSKSSLDPTSANPSAVNDLLQDFGYTAPDQTSTLGMIGDRVWLDVDADGVQDAGEPGLEGVAVTLRNATGAIVATTTTDENGNYWFGGLAAGTYTVVVAPPAGLTQTYDADDMLTPFDTPHKSTVTIGSGGINLDQDFGYRGTGTVGNFVWEDVNADGNVDTGETGIGGVTVDLYWDKNGNGKVDPGEPLVGGTTTAADGSYLFSGLPIDDGGGNAQFVVDVTDDAGKLGGYWHSLGLQGQGNDNESKTDPYAVTLTPGAPNVLTADFGYYVKPAKLGNFVWDDLDADGIQDSGEPGLDGVKVTLTAKYANGTTYTVVTTTGDDPSTTGTVEHGWYSFGNLLLDEDMSTSTTGTPTATQPVYTISVGAPIGYTPTLLDQGSDMSDADNPAGVDGLATEGQTNVTQNANPLLEANPIASYDFGFYRPGVIGNYVWVDENSDGYQDAGEPGIPNVKVLLKNAAGTVIATTYTDAQGGYLFDSLPAGTYYVAVDNTTLPSGMVQTPYNLPGSDFGNQNYSTGNGYQVVLPAGGENLTADFGFNYNLTLCVDGDPSCEDETGTIGDRVWIDADGDGFQDPEEAGVAGVCVQLYTSGTDGLFGTGDDVIQRTDTTDDNGNYLFDNLPPDAYVVEVCASNFEPGGALENYTQSGDPDYFGVTLPSGMGDNETTTPIVLAPGDVFLNADFGYNPPDSKDNTIGDTVWFDADADGVGPASAPGGGDTSEPGIAGVTVSLVNDTNDDGAWDPDGVDNILGNGDDEPIIATDTTDSAGKYLFTGLPDGSYLVWVSDTDNVLGALQATYDADGGNPPAGGSAPTGFLASTVKGLSWVNDLGIGAATPASNLTQDFGYAPPGQTSSRGLIGDRVWLDIDGQGDQDANEPGLEGVTVTLKDSQGNTIATTVTDENGNYYFPNLPAGTYTVVVTAPTGMTQTYDKDGTGTANQSTVTIGGANLLVNLDQDFGYRGTGSIGNLVWEDLNADGNVDTGENGIGGVSLDLYWDKDGNGKVDPGEPLVGSTTTAADGSYLFSGLPTNDGDGNAKFVVDVTDDAGKLGGYWHSLGLQGQADNDESKADPYAVTLTDAAPNVLTADFGYYVKPAAVGNFVWEDLDADGIQDSGEPGIDGVVVTLTVEYANGSSVDVATVTGDDPSTTVVEHGWYSFGNLLADEDHQSSTSGTPTVTQPVLLLTVETPGGYAPTLTGQGSPLADSNDPAGVAAIVTEGQTNVVQNANPSAENTNASYDFGFVRTGVIGNYVWLDEDGDGDQDAGEAGIPNVTVELRLDADGNGSFETLVETTYTDANGGYLFSDLPPGSYQVTVVQGTLPSGLNPTYDENGTNTPNVTTLVLTSGEEHLTADFGYNWSTPCETNTPGAAGCTTPIGAIGDRIWIDVDGDGKQDAGELGIQGVTVALTQPGLDGILGTGDDTTATTTTNAAGYYIFDDLPAGAYIVTVTDTAGKLTGYTQTGDPDHFGTTGPNDNKTTSPVVLGPGDVFLNADFGYQPPVSYTIGDTVFFDANADGTYQPASGEYGIAGVTVALVLDDGDDAYEPGVDRVVATTITGDDPSTPGTVETGWYQFAGLPDGNQYFVWVTDTENVLGDLRQSGEPGEADGGMPCSLCMDVSPEVVPVEPSNSYQDFGYTPNRQAPNRGAIGDTVFLDTNSNSMFEPGEGLEGVKVTLYDSTGTIVLGVTYTDENGYYYFGNLNPNNVTYRVQVDTSTLPNGGAGLTNHVDPDGGDNSYSNWTLTPTAPINLAQDFGYLGTGSIGNLVWNDVNADGNVDSGETGIGGVTIDLYEDRNDNGKIDSGDRLVGQRTTAPDGSYIFDNLPAGNYLVDVTDDAQVLNGYWQSLGNQAQGVDNNSKQDPHAVTLALGQDYVAADFGYYVKPAAVGNFVWEDLNGNGIQDSGEPGINGVEVALTVTYPNGGTTTLQTTTANDPVSGAPGWYSFGNLLLDEDYTGAGTYGAEPTYAISVNTAQPALTGYASSPTGAGTIYTDSNDPTGTSAQPVKGETNTLPSNDGSVIASYDFGFYRWGRIVVDKVTTPNPAGHVFDFALTGGPASINKTFSLTHTADPWNSGNIPSGAATYTITESQDDKWKLVSVECTDADQSVDVTIDLGTGVVSGITLPAGHVITCVFTNNNEGGLDVTMAGVAAAARPDGVLISWQTVSEAEIVGFSVYRGESLDGKWARLNEATIAALTPGAASGNLYEWLDMSYTPGKLYYYVVESVSVDGQVERTDPIALDLAP